MFDEYWNQYVFQFNLLRPKRPQVQKASSYVSTRLTREGVQFVFMMLFVVFAAILQSINLLVLMAGAMMAMLLVQWRLSSRTLSGIRLQRMLPSAIQARRPFSVQLSLRNPRNRLGSWLLMIHDQLVPKETPLGRGAIGHGITILVERLLPQQSRLVGYECTLPFRGSYLFTDPELSTRFPLSLIKGSCSLSLQQTIVVHPTQGTLDSHWRDALKLPMQGKIYRQSSAAGGDGEFYGLRDYRSGDPVRHVHWRTSAKRGQLVIRQFEREESQAISVVLDIATTSRNEKTENSLEEVAIELVASILTKVVVVERSVATVTIISKLGPTTTKIQTTNQLSAALDRLALVVASKRDFLATAIRQTVRYTGGHDPIVVISTRSKSEFLDCQTRMQDLQGKSDEGSLWVNDVSIEGRFIWVDVSREQLGSFFVRG